MGESQQEILIILLGIGIVIGVVGSLFYYFARYGFRTEIDVPPEQRPPSPDGTLSSLPASTAEAPTSARTLPQALSQTRLGLWGRIESLFSGERIPSQLLEEMEEILYTSDLGAATVERLLGAVRARPEITQGADAAVVRASLRQEMLKILGSRKVAGSVLDELGVDPVQEPLSRGEGGPQIWLIVGVNGVGKTTTIGKLAHQLAQGGKRVLVAAGDTFRAAAGAQLKVWSERAQVEFFAPEGVTDPAAVAFSACERAKAQGFEYVIVDTAGRLHTQKNLMEELKKVERVIAKVAADQPGERLLVLDANSGQNAIVQAREFNGALRLTGVILTKMDGTAKGGVALSLAQELGLPIRLIGLGEGLSDLRPFSPQEFVEAIL